MLQVFDHLSFNLGVLVFPPTEIMSQDYPKPVFGLSTALVTYQSLIPCGLIVKVLGTIFFFFQNYNYSKPCLKRPLKIDKNILMANGSLLKVKSIVECPL